jgi:excisionase family DNA binding protein
MLSAPPDVLSTEQAAQLLRCEADAVKEAARRRELPGIKFGREWIFPRAALLEIINKQAMAWVKPAEPAAVSPTGRPALKAVPPVPPARRGGRRTPPTLPEPSGALS